MKSIHLTDTYLGFSGYIINIGNRFYRAITFVLTYLKRPEKLNITFLAIVGNHSTPHTTTLLPILEVSHTIKEQYRQIFFISYESEIK